MIYLDHGATSFPKPAQVRDAVMKAMNTCANPGRGGYAAAMAASRAVFDCREQAAALFDCDPEQAVLTPGCTYALNVAIRTLVKPGMPVAVSGFEHNAVIRPLHALGAKIRVAGRKLFCWEDTLDAFYRALKEGAQAAVFTHVSNVFGYILPVEELAEMCRSFHVPFVLDAAQSAGTLDISMRDLGAAFVAIPGHKGLQGPQGTGLLLCAQPGEPLLYGGTGTASLETGMPAELPERLEAGTLNISGIAGLAAGMALLRGSDRAERCRREQALTRQCANALEKAGMRVFAGEHQLSTVSFLPGQDCEEAAQVLADRGIAVRAGLHCAPMAHESAGTLTAGTVRVSFGPSNNGQQLKRFLREASKLPPFWK